MRLESRSVQKWYFRNRFQSNRFFAVHGADITLLPGRVSVIMGRSGSGKTTLMQMLSGLLTPDEGKVLLEGEDIYALPDEKLCALRRTRFGMIPQGADLLPQLTVKENLLLPLAMEGREKEEGVFKMTRDLLERLGIADLEDVLARELSGGERRRVSIIRALLGTPDFLLADEPTSDLDEENVSLVLTLLKKEAREGRGVLVISHDQEVLSICDDLYQMEAGTLTQKEDWGGRSLLNITAR
ncbi:MAG: ATP-binding cassette domain-containing protein [Blautia sp.]|nr:ATP-binding cassette domain-containing protein [Blautia sp.]